jgi:Protein tyrosine and serine/threonine kinase
MSPEVALCQPCNEKLDVYSYALVVWHMLSHQKPFSGLSRKEFTACVVNGSHRPALSVHWSPELRDLLSR